MAAKVSSRMYSTAKSHGGNIFYNIYNMPWSKVLYCTSRWWYAPDEVVGSSRFVVETGVDVYWLLWDFVVNNSPSVNILGVDASAGYGKSLAAVKLAVDLSCLGWLVIIGFHSHELGRKLFEYVLRYAFVKHGLTGKWWEKLVRAGPLALPRVIYVSGMAHYCPFYGVVPNECGYLGSKCDERTGYVVKYMLERSGVPRSMWGKSVRYLIEHKILNAKQFCDNCPFMRRNGRLRPIPKSYWPDSRSWLGPRVLYTRDVADIVEKYLFPLLHDYDYRRKSWRGTWLKKYVKVLDPRAGICPRRLLLKPIFSRKKKSGGFNNFWLYHGGLIVLAPYELALKIARIAYHVRGGRKILLIIDEADALFFKRGYVPVFPPEEFRKELELFRSYVEFFLWMVRNKVSIASEDDYEYVFGKFKEVVGKKIGKNKLFLRDLLSYILSNKERFMKCFDSIYKFLRRLARSYYGRKELGVGDVLNAEFFEWLSKRLAEVVRYSGGAVIHDMLSSLKIVDYESIRLWNTLYVLSAKDQSRIVVVDNSSNYEYFDRFMYRNVRVSVVKCNKKISPLYGLWLLRSAVSVVLLNNIQYYEYYPYLDEVFSIARNMKVILLSATLTTYYIYMRKWFDTFSNRYGVSYQVRSLLSINDVFDPNMKKRVRVVRADDLREVRVHKFLKMLPRYLLSRFVLKFNNNLRELVEFVKKNNGVVIVTQNKASAEYLSKIFAGALKESDVKLDSGYYFKGRVLITWLRSKLNRGVNVHDIDPKFVAKFFIFVGTFLSSIRRVKVYEYGEPPSGIVFSLDWVKGYYFSIEYIDEIYSAEVLCWIEQFVGRALRVSRSFGVCVYVVVPGDLLLSFGVGVYLLSVIALLEYEEIEKAFDVAFERYIEFLRKAESSRNEYYKEAFRRRAEKWLRRASSIEELLGSTLFDNFVFSPNDVKRVVPWLWKEYVIRVKSMFEIPVYAGSEDVAVSPI